MQVRWFVVTIWLGLLTCLLCSCLRVYGPNQSSRSAALSRQTDPAGDSTDEAACDIVLKDLLGQMAAGAEILLPHLDTTGKATTYRLDGRVLTIPESVRLVFAPGARLADGTLICHGAIQADPGQCIFAEDLTVELRQSAVPVGYPAWMAGPDIGARINRLVEAGIQHIYVPDTGRPQPFEQTIIVDRPGVVLEIQNRADLRFSGTGAACEIMSDDIDLRGGMWTYVGDAEDEVSGIRVTAVDEHINGVYLWPAKVIGFTNGLHLYSGTDTGSGSGWGICYSRFRWKGLIKNRTCIKLETAGNGWINSCLFEGYRANSPGVEGSRGIHVVNNGWNIQAHRFVGNWEHLGTVLEIESTGKWTPVGYEIHGYFEKIGTMVVGSSQEVFIENWRNRHVYTQIFAGSRYYTTLFDLKSDNPPGHALLRRVQTTAEQNEPGLEYVTEHLEKPLFKILEDGSGFVHRGEKLGLRVWNVTVQPGDTQLLDLCQLNSVNCFLLDIVGTTDAPGDTALYEKLVVSTHKEDGSFHAATVERIGFQDHTVQLVRGEDDPAILRLKLGTELGSTTHFFVQLRGRHSAADAPF